MAIERRLTELAGPVGGRLHTARSRNDQVVTDLAMYTRERAAAAQSAIAAADGACCSPAPRSTSTGRCPATPTCSAPSRSTSATTCSPTSGCSRATARASPSPSTRPGALPLGAGALAGVNFDTDRALVAAELGFREVAPNSIDAVSGRDFVLDYLAAAATCATHLSRLGAELVLWSSSEFGFCELPDAWSSGSSIMPQKKNPDAAELLRAKAPRVVGHLAALHGVIHALPLTYNKDLQEDKEHLFDAVDTIELTLAAARGCSRACASTASGCAQAASDELLAATDVADLLVRLRRSVPRGPRRRRRARAHGARQRPDALELTPRSSPRTATSSPRTASSTTRCSQQGSWLESKISEGGTATSRAGAAGRAAARTLARGRARDGSMRWAALRALLLRAPGARGRPRADRLRRRARAGPPPAA